MVASHKAVAGTVDTPSPNTASHPGSQAAPASSPQTYPDPDGFARRVDALVDALILQDLDTYRRGYFSGGDPGKYLPGHAMARLLSDPDSPEAKHAVELMNDGRSFKEHYHFAAINWARFLPMFADEALKSETQKKLADEAFRYSAYLSGTGTENHKTMWMTSANVLPHFLIDGGGLSHKGRDETLRVAKEKLRTYVKGLYAAGSGEWDSPTYSMFTGHGLMNIYDFSPDPETRLIAKAGLDWIAAYYALKHVDGLYAPPNQRGHYREAYESIVDQTGYLWWGGDREIDAKQMRDWRYAIHAATSSYRPSNVLTNIAKRELPDLPVEVRTSKPNYWYGLGHKPIAGVTKETLYLHPNFTMASLWSGHASQCTRFGVAVKTDAGGVLVTGGHPRRSDHTGKKIDLGYRDGISRYLQSAQVGPAYVALALVPDDDPIDHVFVSLPEDVEVESFGGWLTFRVGEVTLAVHGIGAPAEQSTAMLTDKQQSQNQKDIDAGKPPRHEPENVIKVSGRRVGFVVEVLDATAEDAIEHLLRSANVDVSNLENKASFRYRAVAGEMIDFTFNPDSRNDRHGDQQADVKVDGEPIDFDNWSIASGPFVVQRPGRLTVNDGREGFTVEFTGDVPVYQSWQP